MLGLLATQTAKAYNPYVCDTGQQRAGFHKITYPSQPKAFEDFPRPIPLAWNLSVFFERLLWWINIFQEDSSSAKVFPSSCMQDCLIWLCLTTPQKEQSFLISFEEAGPRCSSLVFCFRGKHLKSHQKCNLLNNLVICITMLSLSSYCTYNQRIVSPYKKNCCHWGT